MCGIAGIVYRESDRRVEPQTVERMCSAIRHRGPDDWGCWTDGAVGIGMVRLRIIDLESGRQPMTNEDRSVWIVFNGEIYNYQELRRLLDERGHRFATRSDTETILHLYEEYGEECVQHLRGMFAFAIWDTKKCQLLLARDRLGIKPLHYLDDGERLIFGSEIKALLAAPEVPRRFHPSALVNYLAYGYVPDPDTMFEGIRKLPPGHVLIHGNGRTTVRQYWDVRYAPEPQREEAYYLERTEELLREAVRIRLMSEVPLGAFLSGGIDSSLVVAMMAQQMSEPVKTFSIGFADAAYSELPYARIVAERYGTDHHEEIVTPEADAVIPALVRQFDEPFADSSAIPTYYVSRLARRTVTVTLSGDGGDELFGGYGRYRDGQLVHWAEHVPLGIRRPVLLGAGSVLPEGFPGVNTLRHLGLDADERYLKKMSGGLSLIHPQVFSDTLTSRLGTTDPTPVMRRYLTRVADGDTLSRRQYLDTKTYLPGDILTKVDRTSMLVSLEARVPLLDHRIVEFAATVPPRYQIRGGEGKALLKKLALRFLPPEMINRPKRGFSIPIGDWVNHEWRELSDDLLLSEQSVKRGYLNPKFVKRIVDEHRRGRRGHGNLIWSLMVLEWWFREFLDG